MKRFYTLFALLLTVLAVNATTIKGDVYKWDSATNSATKADAQIEEEVTIKDNVVTFSNFLGSSIEFIANVSADGTVSDNQKTGTLSGNFTFGSFGSYTSIYLYAGYYSYNDFSYSVTDGVKTLHFGCSAGSSNDWYDVYFYLPDDFQPYDPYADKTIIQLPATFMGLPTTLKAYVEDNKLNVIGMLGGTTLVTYYFNEAGDLVNNLTPSWIDCDYTYNGTSNSWAYNYGPSYVLYDNSTRKVSDYFWLYTTNAGSDLIFTLPSSIVSPITTVKGDVYAWDASAQKAVAGEKQINEDLLINGGTITFKSFLGSSNKITATVYEDGSVSDDQTTGIIAGSFDLGSYGKADSLYLYAGSWNYPDFTYSVSDGVKTLHFGCYAYATADSTVTKTWYDIYFYLPDDFTPADKYADKNTLNLPVSFVQDNTTNTESLQFRAYIEDNKLNIISLFGASDLITYSFTEDGAITSNLNAKYYGCSYDDNGTSNSWIYFYGTQYLSYDASTRTVKDYVWLYNSNRGGYFSFVLPEGIEVPSNVTGISNVATEENGPVEFFNMQGVRVLNPTNGLFIRRQGSNVQKVLIK